MQHNADRPHRILFEVMGDLWSTLLSGREPSPAQIARFTTTHTYVVGVCVESVNTHSRPLAARQSIKRVSLTAACAIS